ncbi:ribokinase-like isoform X2 [Gigantopelta aegis]|uniref:ribokinase-like isoform X2 n=1 Tax=Gigantopelta aegis TaxID=1735272 RepID=UPI001B889F90|nr:ribokinase-like isoform X2 [Gigantopelta aegis]
MTCYVPRHPKPGETITGSKFIIGCGGKGANQCIMAGRLGATVAMVSKVGVDTFGQNYFVNFKENNVNIDFVGVTEHAATGAAAITVSDAGENTIVVVPGANMLLTENDIRDALPVIKGTKVLTCQLEVSPEATIFALKTAKEHGVQTILNAAPAPPSAKDVSEDLFSLCDIFCVNEQECEVFTDLPVGTVEEAKAAVLCLFNKGCNTVVITLGERGVVYGSRQHKDVKHIEAEKVVAVDTTGAGDAFVGSLAYFLAKHPEISLHDALTKSCRIAAISVQANGTQSSYPWKKDIPDLV